ncbi:hypothetical protein PISMIDRAFT_674768 [Pisolithus microcarpus 441]|uniref:Uncharacterized protein n=1 Tax=Pisolithus microcarpus 441 TaxID=765257 RepID=A0A0D0A5U8_9AGAM|nr:hypothetical protein PISMIDRAFT_674768 [Pisolithus microcarpus 441]
MVPKAMFQVCNHSVTQVSVKSSRSLCARHSEHCLSPTEVPLGLMRGGPGSGGWLN